MLLTTRIDAIHTSMANGPRSCLLIRMSTKSFWSRACAIPTTSRYIFPGSLQHVSAEQAFQRGGTRYPMEAALHVHQRRQAYCDGHSRTTKNVV